MVMDKSDSARLKKIIDEMKLSRREKIEVSKCHRICYARVVDDGDIYYVAWYPELENISCFAKTPRFAFDWLFLEKIMYIKDKLSLQEKIPEATYHHEVIDYVGDIDKDKAKEMVELDIEKTKERGQRVTESDKQGHKWISRMQLALMSFLGILGIINTIDGHYVFGAGLWTVMALIFYSYITRLRYQ